MHWIQDWASHDLQNQAQMSLSLSELRDLFQRENLDLSALVIVNGRSVSYELPCQKTYVNNPKLTLFLKALSRALGTFPKLKTAFIYQCTDYITVKEALPIPVFGVCKKNGSPGVLVPDDPLENLYSYATREAAQHPWSQKVDKAYFWGTTTSSKKISLKDMWEHPRLKIVKLGKKYPEEIESGFSSLFDRMFLDHQSLDAFLNEENTFQSRPQSDILNYRYALDIDGISNAWKRSRYILSSNSLSLKQKSSYRQWFYPRLKKEVHYIELKNDLSDLFEKLSWARSHEKRAQSVIETSTAFAHKHFSPSAQLMYLYFALLNYANVIKVSL